MKKIAEQLNEKFLTYQELERMKEEEENISDDEHASTTLDKILKRIESKPVSAQAELYKKLFMAVLNTATTAPNMERKLRPVYRDFLKSGFKKED